jgi:hypothetical protein
VLKVRQRKTARKGQRRAAVHVPVPVAEPLKITLDAALAARNAMAVPSTRICLNSDGEPWREGKQGFNGFVSSFRKARMAAGIDGVSFSDLRGTAVTRLALNGGPGDLRDHRA